MLFLLEAANPDSPSGTPLIELCGSRWTIKEYANFSDAPPYTCISYTWMKATKEHPFDAGQQISARTIPVIETVIKTLQSPDNWSYVKIDIDPQQDAVAKSNAIAAGQALWIDALCIPQQEPDRTLCLQRMGELYSSAWQVFVVLSESCSPIFRQIKNEGCIDFDALSIFERDEWITRAWTYQETVNSRALYFIGENDEGYIVPGTNFLSIVQTAIDNYRELLELKHIIWIEQHPKLDNFQTLIADYRSSEYSERTAYQVMSAMHSRLAERADDYFYAMIGAVTKFTIDINGAEHLSPSEYFMRACEAKRDFSYIYNIAPRNGASGKHWRPVEGKFQPVVPGQLIFGSGQAGCVMPTHIRLDNMCRVGTGTISANGRKAVLFLLPKDREYLTSQAIAEATLDWLRRAGFSGCGEYFELESGFFFPQSMPNIHEDYFIAVSPGVEWGNGCPGLLLYPDKADINHFLSVGAFVGRVPKGTESLCIG
ncbi:MAG: HET domain-containing protein [Desulfobacteraceae bacterium]|nr:HET domain-containing protein [Desulfobacteraceae bacterium]